MSVTNNPFIESPPLSIVIAQILISIDKALQELAKSSTPFANNNLFFRIILWYRCVLLVRYVCHSKNIINYHFLFTPKKIFVSSYCFLVRSEVGLIKIRVFKLSSNYVTDPDHVSHLSIHNAIKRVYCIIYIYLYLGILLTTTA